VHFIRTRHYKQILPEKVKDLIVQIDRKNEAENAAFGELDFEEMGLDEPLDSNRLEQKINGLNQRLKA
jgi:hypothetical protein